MGARQILQRPWSPIHPRRAPLLCIQRREQKKIVNHTISQYECLHNRGAKRLATAVEALAVKGTRALITPYVSSSARADPGAVGGGVVVSTASWVDVYVETRYTTTERGGLAVTRCMAEAKWLIQGSDHPTNVYTLFRDGTDTHGKAYPVRVCQVDLHHVYLGLVVQAGHKLAPQIILQVRGTLVVQKSSLHSLEPNAGVLR